MWPCCKHVTAITSRTNNEQTNLLSCSRSQMNQELTNLPSSSGLQKYQEWTNLPSSSRLRTNLEWIANEPNVTMLRGSEWEFDDEQGEVVRYRALRDSHCIACGTSCFVRSDQVRMGNNSSNGCCNTSAIHLDYEPCCCCALQRIPVKLLTSAAINGQFHETTIHWVLL